MRIFVAGASGVIGRQLLPLLLQDGHQVVALTRSPARVDSLQAAGAEPVVADALDAEALADAVVLARPDLVIHQLTSLPPTPDPRRHAAAYTQTARLRRQGTRNLLRAATAAGVRRVIAQSIAFGYAPDDGPASEAAALLTTGPRDLRDTIAAAADLERQVLNAAGLQGVVLRYGHLYGPETWYAPDGPIGQQIRKRRFPIVGDGMGCFSFVHIADAATATVAALGSAAAGVYNVVDDDPAPLRAWLPWYAKTLGAPPPRHIPTTLARLAAGDQAVYLATRQRGASNAKARQQLGWQPHYRSWRTGFAATSSPDLLDVARVSSGATPPGNGFQASTKAVSYLGEV
jgi:nucleoside-diphosphate-sugar epimerase